LAKSLVSFGSSSGGHGGGVPEVPPEDVVPEVPPDEVVPELPPEDVVPGAPDVVPDMPLEEAAPDEVASTSCVSAPEQAMKPAHASKPRETTR
jgi:hypothetical protein